MSSTRSTSGTILLILVLVLTAPIWMAVGGVLIGVLGGIFGGLLGVFFGVFGALLGGLFALIALPFKMLFGEWSCFDGDWFNFSGRGFFLICLVLLVAVMIKRNRAVK